MPLLDTSLPYVIGFCAEFGVFLLPATLLFTPCVKYSWVRITLWFFSFYKEKNQKKLSSLNVLRR